MPHMHLFTGHYRRFTDNRCGDNGGVITTTMDTAINVEGGHFSGNKADEVSDSPRGLHDGRK